jgi:hypothetical protein
MKNQIPFSIFGGGPNGPNIAKKIIIILGVWIIVKGTTPRPSGGGGLYKISKPKLIVH